MYSRDANAGFISPVYSVTWFFRNYLNMLIWWSCDIIIIIAEILDSATAFKLIFASKCFASHSYQKNRWFLCVFLLFE